MRRGRSSARPGRVAARFHHRRGNTRDHADPCRTDRHRDIAMNCNYRLVWNALSATQVPAPETAKGRGKSGVRSNARRLGALGVYAAGITLGGHAWALDANTLPGGGQVVGGSSTLTQSGNTLTVNQSSTRSIISLVAP